MSNPSSIFERYDTAMRAYASMCVKAPDQWHRADVAEFTELYGLLLPHAESGDGNCQYALATILSWGLRCESETEFLNRHSSLQEEASRWWIAAAKQGLWRALDNLITSGVGPEPWHAREAARQLERERPDLVPRSDGMPVYWQAFGQELCRRFYGRVRTEPDWSGPL